MHDPILAPGLHPVMNGVPWIGEVSAKSVAQSRPGTPCRFGLIDGASCRAGDWQKQ